MGRTINIALVFSICFALSWCDNGTPQQPSGKEQTPSPQNQADSKPLSGEQHWIRGNLLRAEAKYEEATTEYQLAIDKGYDSNWARTELGMVLDHYLHRPEEAIKHFRVAIQRDENDWRAHWLLANSLLTTKQYDEALRELQIVKRLDPKNTSTVSYLYATAKALDGLDRSDEALKEYEAFLQRAKKVEPNSPRVREVLARVEAIKSKSGKL